MSDRRIALLFDMDGVIIDSTPVHTAAWYEYLSLHGLDIPDVGSRMLGRHNDEIVQDFFSGRNLTLEEIAAHGQRKEAIYRERMRPQFAGKLVPGIVDFVRGYRRLPMAVASNAEPANTDFVLAHAAIRDCFEVVVSGHDVERPKPEPDIYLRAAELLRVPPGNCVVFEDSDTGVTAARRAGMKVVGVLTTLSQFDNVDIEIRDFQDPAIRRWVDAMCTPAGR